MIQIVTAIEHDGMDMRILTLVFDVPDARFDLMAAIRAAVMDFLRTDEGKAVWNHNCHNFNWADFDTHISADLCHAHGFEKYSSDLYADVIVNWDEELADESESEDDCEVDVEESTDDD